MEEHRYSTFALDVYWAAEAARDPDLEAHLAACERCRGYLDHLRSIDARTLALPAARASRRRWFVPAFAFAVALAAGVVLWFHASPAPTYVASKGAPAIQVLVRRDGATHLWDPEFKIRDRDVLALRVACEAMTRVTVLVADRGDWKQTFEGACQDDVLPFTLVVDDDPGDDRIAIVLGRAPLDQASARLAADSQTKNADVWALTFVLTKESHR